MELRKLHHVDHQFCDRRVLHLPGGEGDEQDEETVSNGRAGGKRLSGLRDDDPGKGKALSALHD